jgi:hypothetical protein
MPGGLPQLHAQHVHAGFDGGEHVQGGGGLQLPDRGQMGGRGLRSLARPCSVRKASSPSRGAPWWKNTAWIRCTQAVCSRRRS